MGALNKVLDFFGMDTGAEEVDENENDIYGYDYNDIDEPEEIESRGIFNRRNKVVNMPQSQPVRMVISQPTNFEQSEEICNYLKEKKSIIVNLE